MRVYVLPETFNRREGLIRIEGKDAKYLLSVLRMRTGSRFAGRDRDGTLWNLEVVSMEKGRCSLYCSPSRHMCAATTETLPSPEDRLPEIHLYQCLCKGKKMETIIRQATEIGATRIIPVQSEHCVSDLLSKERDSQASRWERFDAIVKEALQQSGSATITSVDPPISFEQIAGDWNSRGPGLFFHEKELGGSLSVGDALELLANRSSQETLPVALVIGPEGGLSSQETKLLESHAFQAVRLRTNILRAETAAVYALAVVQTLLAHAEIGCMNTTIDHSK